ncbi:MAG: histidine phosphatase family protein [Bryobacteraceae bacterium]
MQICILRHGIAEDGFPGMRDADRALTSEGKAKLREVLQRAKQAGVNPGLILTSPYRRARETAEIAASICNSKAPLIETQALVPHSSPELVWEEIRIHNDQSEILLASHEPLLGDVYAYLLGTPGVRIEVKKGSLGRIDIERMSGAPRGVLRWLLTAKLAAE